MKEAGFHFAFVKISKLLLRSRTKVGDIQWFDVKYGIIVTVVTIKTVSAVVTIDMMSW